MFQIAEFIQAVSDNPDDDGTGATLALVEFLFPDAGSAYWGSEDTNPEFYPHAYVDLGAIYNGQVSAFSIASPDVGWTDGPFTLAFPFGSVGVIGLFGGGFAYKQALDNKDTALQKKISERTYELMNGVGGPIYQERNGKLSIGVPKGVTYLQSLMYRHAFGFRNLKDGLLFFDQNAKLDIVSLNTWNGLEGKAFVDLEQNYPCDTASRAFGYGNAMPNASGYTASANLYNGEFADLARRTAPLTNPNLTPADPGYYIVEHPVQFSVVPLEQIFAGHGERYNDPTNPSYLVDDPHSWLCDGAQHPNSVGHEVLTDCVWKLILNGGNKYGEFSYCIPKTKDFPDAPLYEFDGPPATRLEVHPGIDAPCNP
jgi:hypothetical protein